MNNCCKFLSYLNVSLSLIVLSFSKQNNRKGKESKKILKAHTKKSSFFLLNKTMLFCAIIISFFLIGCEKHSDVKGAGWLGYPSFGSPDIILRNTVDKIDPIVHYPCDFKKIQSLIPKNSRFIYFSYDTESNSYQLAWWSGETTWVYSSKEKKYYETKQDLMNASWYMIKDDSYPSSLNSVKLYGK